MLTLGAVALVLLARSDVLHESVLGLLEAARDVIDVHPIAGPLAFVALSAASAMLGFVSSVALVPAALLSWGPIITGLLLWIGWLLGGLAAYAVAAWLGRPALRWLIPSGALSRYRNWLDRRPSFASVVILQLALPSEVPGYLLGLARYPVERYFAALAIAELPYVVGTVLLGLSFVERRIEMMIVLTVAGVLGLGLLVRVLRTTRPASIDPAVADTLDER